MFFLKKNIESIQKLFSEIKNYINLQKELLQLTAAEKATTVITLLVVAVAFLFLGSFMFLFLACALAIYLGELFNNYAAGFGITAGVLLLLALLILIFRRQLIINPIARIMTKVIVRKKDGK